MGSLKKTATAVQAAMKMKRLWRASKDRIEEEDGTAENYLTPRSTFDTQVEGEQSTLQQENDMDDETFQNRRVPNITSIMEENLGQFLATKLVIASSMDGSQAPDVLKKMLDSGFISGYYY